MSEIHNIPSYIRMRETLDGTQPNLLRECCPNIFHHLPRGEVSGSYACSGPDPHSADATDMSDSGKMPSGICLVCFPSRDVLACVVANPRKEDVSCFRSGREVVHGGDGTDGDSWPNDHLG